MVILFEKKIKVELNGYNRKRYEEILNKNLSNYGIIEIQQKFVPKTSRIEVECICDYCGKYFFRKRVYIKGEATLCTRKCRNEWLKQFNPNPPKEKIKVNCNVCDKEILINEAKYKKQKYFLCSRECYKKHRSIRYKGENTYNYNSFSVKCKNCNKKLLATPYDIESRRFLFCSQKCYWNHRSKYYLEYYYLGHFEKQKIETKPERLVREWLDNNNIRYEQERPFIKYFIDFYLIDYDVGLEVYGDYWHVNPKIYGNSPNLKPLTAQQIGVREYDNFRNSQIRQHFPLYIIWESEIYEDIDFYMDRIMSKITNRESVTTVRLAPTDVG